MEKIKKTISLGVLAKKLNTTKSKLVYYNILGLIKPDFQMTGGIRVFDELKTIKQINLIRKYRKKGMSLKDIAKKINSNENINRTDKMA